jgi:hypothetical protein
MILLCLTLPGTTSADSVRDHEATACTYTPDHALITIKIIYYVQRTCLRQELHNSRTFSSAK